MLADLGYASLQEFNFNNGRRADVAAIERKGNIVIVEIKSSVADYRADNKWPDYLDHCDRFYFAVDETFPVDILPEDQGLIIADRYGAEIVRQAEVRKVNAARRKALTLSFARTAARRLTALLDPPPE